MVGIIFEIKITTLKNYNNSREKLKYCKNLKIKTNFHYLLQRLKIRSQFDETDN